MTTDNTSLGLRYSILKVVGLNSSEVSAKTRFRSGDRIRLKVQVNHPGYLYVVNQGSSGAWRLMYPAPQTPKGANRVEAGEEYLVPDALMRFDSKPGTERLFLIVSREQERTLERLIYAQRGGGPSGLTSTDALLAADLGIEDDVIRRLRDAYSREFVRHVLIEESTLSANDQATYVVNTSARADSRVVVDIPLVHQ